MTCTSSCCAFCSYGNVCRCEDSRRLHFDRNVSSIAHRDAHDDAGGMVATVVPNEQSASPLGLFNRAAGVLKPVGEIGGGGIWIQVSFVAVSTDSGSGRGRLGNGRSELPGVNVGGASSSSSRIFQSRI